CLELTEHALQQALHHRANFIFTHHPFIFKPIKRINIENDSKGKILELLIKNNITLYSAHTNLDFAKGGVSFELARILGIDNPEFLLNDDSNQFKVVVFVPKENIEVVSEAIFSVGAGIIGEYEKCSFRLNGVGSFKGSEFTNPAIGKKQNYETVEEIRFEVIVDSWKLNDVVNAIKISHPYEEPAFDVYPLKNENINFGFGAIGDLKKSYPPNIFMEHVCKSLKTKNLRFTTGNKRRIKKVAVCGGSGSQLLNAAIKAGADAFVTADIKYHTFQDGEGKILFIDAGHYETEIHVLNAVKRKLEKFIKINGESVKVHKYSGTTNPIKFFNNKGVK
ncbi:MAG: Nif3-like dinuclear metal center hexameric protein, partial [Melioribacteraceae bacterium]|nr:Nif3-like dinuclear metal center hexameric protein [Melioribacteraceae bacterium]